MTTRDPQDPTQDLSGQPRPFESESGIGQDVPVDEGEERGLVPLEGERGVAAETQDPAPRMPTEWVIQPGTEVVDANGTFVGRVDDVSEGHLVVRKGRFFVADYYIPVSAVGSYDDTTIYLAVVADEQAAKIWHQRPSERGEGQAAGDEGFAELDAETRMAHLTDRDGNVRIPVLQEDLVASRRPVVRGKVRIETTLSEETRTLQVPVTEERVRVQRRTFGQDASGADITIDGGTFEVPFYGEDVDLERTVRVIEEIIITREAIETIRTVRGTVRREDVTVDDADVPTIDDDGPVALSEGSPERPDQV
ncbi:MAG TPA: DUF2382 domain-containing protein [Thermomicrobiales bacterium]|nr:DUF2382 domain-containing protein [Thermomicrobiales bacterium]